MAKFKDFNNRLALRTTNFIGSTTCAYIFCALALYGLTGVDFHNAFQIVSWISQTFLQLVLLSVIMIGQNLASEKTENRAQQDHETIMAEMTLLKQMHEENMQAYKEIKDHLDALKRKGN